MHTGVDPLLSQPRPSDHRVGDALGDEHSVAARQVLAARPCTGHDQVLYKGETTTAEVRTKVSSCCIQSYEYISLSQANVTEFLDTEGLPRELGGEDDWQYSWQVFSQNQRKMKPRYFVLLSRNSAISQR